MIKMLQINLAQTLMALNTPFANHRDLRRFGNPRAVVQREDIVGICDLLCAAGVVVQRCWVEEFGEVYKRCWFEAGLVADYEDAVGEEGLAEGFFVGWG